MTDSESFAAMVAGLTDIGFSRVEIAQGTGLSRQTLWRIERGQARAPSYKTVERLKNFAENRSDVTPTLRFRG